MTQLLHRSLIALFMTLCILSLSLNSQAQDSFDRQAMLRDIVENAILPSYEAAFTAAQDLETAANALAEAPSATTLADTQAAWHTVSGAWQEVQVYTLNLTLIAMHNQVNKLPINTEYIDDLINTQEDISEETVIHLGSTRKGLSVLEYLLFGSPDSLSEFVDHPHRGIVLTAFAAGLRHDIGAVYDYWSPEGDDYAQQFINADMEDGNVQGAVNMLANEMFFILEDILQMRLGQPTGLAGGDPLPDRIEAPYSQSSFGQIQHTLIGLQRAFNGGAVDEDSLGFADYLNYLDARYGDERLSDAINQHLESAIAELDSEMSLSEIVATDPELVLPIYESIRQALVLFRVDMASQMNILLTLSDRDGDQ